MRFLRDHIDQPVSLDYFQQRTAAGWKLKAIEWQKDEEQEIADSSAPYGLEVVPDTARLQEKPEETDVLRTVLELIVVEKGVAHIAAELNARGYTTRHGRPWTATAVFNLLPRLIDTAPDLLKSEEWQTRRAKLRPGSSSKTA